MFVVEIGMSSRQSCCSKGGAGSLQSSDHSLALVHSQFANFAEAMAKAAASTADTLRRARSETNGESILPG